MNNLHSEAASTDRRAFLRNTTLAGAGLRLSPRLLSAMTPQRRRLYALVGTGSRARNFRRAVQETYAASSEMVGPCDLNPGRLELARERSKPYGATLPPGYAPEDSERMIRETQPDFVGVTTMDSTQDDYIVRALEAACDVITEKPMTTDQSKGLRIRGAIARPGTLP